jgi:hypothetical protein
MDAATASADTSAVSTSTTSMLVYVCAAAACRLRSSMWRQCDELVTTSSDARGATSPAAAAAVPAAPRAATVSPAASAAADTHAHATTTPASSRIPRLQRLKLARDVTVVCGTSVCRMSGAAVTPAAPLASLDAVASLEGHSDRVWHVSWHPTLDMLATCGGDRRIRLWTPRSRDDLFGCAACAVTSQPR